jgi:hypothetical protein
VEEIHIRNHLCQEVGEGAFFIKWTALAEKLNGVPNGARKSVVQWKTFLTEWRRVSLVGVNWIGGWT